MDEQNNEQADVLQREHDRELRELRELENKYQVLSEEHLVLREEFDNSKNKSDHLNNKWVKHTFKSFLVYRTETSYGYKLRFIKKYGHLYREFTVPVQVQVQGMASETTWIDGWCITSTRDVEEDDDEEDEDDEDSTERRLDGNEKQNLLHKLVMENDDIYERICSIVESNNKQRDELDEETKHALVRRFFRIQELLKESDEQKKQMEDDHKLIMDLSKNFKKCLQQLEKQMKQWKCYCFFLTIIICLLFLHVW